MYYEYIQVVNPGFNQADADHKKQVMNKYTERVAGLFRKFITLHLLPGSIQLSMSGLASRKPAGEQELSSDRYLKPVPSLLTGSLSVLFCFMSHVASSQMPFTLKESESDFNRGMDLFNKEKYPAAIRFFDSFIANGDQSNFNRASEAEYFSSLASLYLFNPDAESRMLGYITEHSESPRINDARLALGDYFYQSKNYGKAVTYFETVNRQELSPEKLPEYFFRLGYSLYIKGDKKRALLMFSEIKDIDTEYTPPAIYYSSQIAYEDKMYETALEGFKRLKDDETFGSIVPYYIVQILYMQKNYDSILAMAPPLLASSSKERSTELYRFIGDAYYNKGNYKDALLNLEKYYEQSKTSQREEKYQLGYCYYKTGNNDKAVKMLLEVEVRKDSLSQNLWNVLADCYLKKNDKQRAQYAFGEAASLNFDRNLSEESLFNYAKLTYELGNSPFGEAIAAFQAYIDRYPGSERIQEVYDYLVETFIQVKNYKAALSALDKISEKDDRLKEAYQRVTFYRGLEMFKNMEIGAAAAMCDKSLIYQKYSRSVMARAIYWRGEAEYRLSGYDSARMDYELFMGIPGSSQLNENNLVRYNLGYAYFNLKNYTSALSHFLAFESASARVSPVVLSDARNRIADCYYIATSYQPAISYYDKVINSGSENADYAMFRKGFSLGLMNNNKGKVDELTELKAKYPSSSLVPDALYERGRAYLVLEDYKRGEDDFNSIISGYPASQYVPMAMVQLGLLYYNLGENEKAIPQYKKVIENFRSTPEARNALTGLKNSYVDMNDVSSYFTYLKTVDGYGDVNMAEKDSLTYASGENLFISAKYDKASELFKSYLGEFPNGSFRQNAEFYLAESLKSSGKDDEALSYYMQVASEAGTQFVEQSLVIASEMQYQKEDYSGAFASYEKLEKVAGNEVNKMIAMKGQLMAAAQLGDAAKTIAAADKINNSPAVPEELFREATFLKAKANYTLSNFDDALSDFKKVAREVTSAEGAESKYRVAELLYRKNMADESEKVITEFINQNTPHQYWMARVFLLLADISIKKGDLLQARATLQSLKDYYSITNDGILDEVKTRLDSISENK